MNLTDNQTALLNEVYSGRRWLVNCVGGYAAWRTDIKWSQGRTPQNAVSAEDIEALQREGFIEKDGYGKLWLAAYHAEPLAPFALWAPANEGYTGEPFIP